MVRFSSSPSALFIPLSDGFSTCSNSDWPFAVEPPVPLIPLDEGSVIEPLGKVEDGGNVVSPPGIGIAGGAGMVGTAEGLSGIQFLEVDSANAVKAMRLSPHSN